MKLYNTLSREKEEFVPLDGKTVTMYSCGPTVYNYAHIGNLRTYIFMDMLRRTLKYAGYKIKGVMNVTDVGHLLSDGDEGEDKMELAAKKQQKRPEEIAAYYSEVFFKDLERLNIGKPEIIAKATDNIKEMIEYVEDLLRLGYAYETSDAIYFDISKFPEYGKLSRLNLDEQIAGARVQSTDEKRHPADFALWKKAEPNHIMQWDSPWGKGYPGWHIECSAMSRKYLGKLFDIHTGGVDHIPVHHENEIAQSEAREGGKTVRFWMHGEFMQVDGGKMSKSLGNTYTVDQLIEKGYSPMDFRYFCLNAHYRKKLNFTFESLDAAKTSYERLLSLLVKHKHGSAKADEAEINKYMNEFDEAAFDDINIPLCLGTLWTMLKSAEPSKGVYEAALKMDKVLGLSLDKAETTLTAIKPAEEEEEIPAEIAELASKRFEAKKARDFATADALRNRLSELGYVVADSKDGYTVTKKR